MTTPISVTVTRVFRAPIELVWQAWTDPSRLRLWMKCEPSVELDVRDWEPRKGARFAYTMRKSGLWEVETTGSFLEVAPPHALAYELDANSKLGMPAQTVRLALERAGEGTKVTLTHTGIPSDEIRGVVSAGWSGSLSLLDDLLRASPADGARAEASRTAMARNDDRARGAQPR